MTIRSVGLASCLLLAACGGGGGGNDGTSPPDPSSNTPPPAPTLSVSGAVQKGPFLVGSTVLVNKLDAQGKPTESTIVTQIDDSIGSFSFKPSTPGPVQIVASGYYFSELTGNVSNGTLTLKALYNVGSASTQIAYVNILTHLINDRVLQLVSGSQLTLSNAIAQAEREFLDAFAPALPVGGFDNFAALSLYNVDGTSDVGNAYLLALSTAFYKYAALRAEEFGGGVDAELTLILNQISDDLRDDGQIQRAGFIDDFIDAVRSLSPTEIAENLRRRSIVDYPSGLDVPDISRFLNQCAGAAECAWSNGAPLPAPSRGFAAVQFGEQLYLFGGVTHADFSPTPPYESLPTAFSWTRMYDPASSTWTAKSPMPVGGSTSVRAHIIGQKIYVFPAYNTQGYRNEVLEYDPLADSWAVKPPGPTYRYSYSSAAIDGKVYLLGGYGGLDDGPQVGGEVGAYKSHVEIYDPATDSWSTAQPAPGPFSSAASCSLGDEIYVFGGYDANGTRALSWVYNVATDSWSAKSPMPEPREYADCVRVGDLFYVIGGRSSGGIADTVNRYDPATDSWSVPTRMREPRDFIEGAAVGSKIFIMGGYANGSFVDTVDILDTAVRLP